MAQVRIAKQAIVLRNWEQEEVEGRYVRRLEDHCWYLILDKDATGNVLIEGPEYRARVSQASAGRWQRDNN